MAIKKDVKTTTRRGVSVKCGDKIYAFPQGYGWNLVQSTHSKGSDMMVIAGEKIQEGDRIVNETLATFKVWDWVGWSSVMSIPK